MTSESSPRLNNPGADPGNQREGKEKTVLQACVGGRKCYILPTSVHYQWWDGTRMSKNDENDILQQASAGAG